MTDSPPASNTTRRLSGSRQVVVYPPPASDTITLPTEDLRTLFDLVAQSLNFGSGFLDTDDVTMLRRTAVALGVDPIEGTPLDFAPQYPHRYGSRNFRGSCCWKDADHPCHIPDPKQ